MRERLVTMESRLRELADGVANVIRAMDSVGLWSGNTSASNVDVKPAANGHKPAHKPATGGKSIREIMIELDRPVSVDELAELMNLPSNIVRNRLSALIVRGAVVPVEGTKPRKYQLVSASGGPVTEGEEIVGSRA